MHGILFIIIKQRYTYWDDLEGREDVLVHNSFCRVQNQRKFARSCMICCLCDPIRLMLHLILIAKFIVLPSWIYGNPKDASLWILVDADTFLCDSFLVVLTDKGMIASWSIFSGFYHRFYARTFYGKIQCVYVYDLYTLIAVILIPQWESCWEFHLV